MSCKEDGNNEEQIEEKRGHMRDSQLELKVLAHTHQCLTSMKT